VRRVVQQQCGLFWPVRWPEACGLGLFKRKIGFVGAATTTLALFALRLKSVLLLAHKAGSKHALCPFLGKQNKSKKLPVRSLLKINTTVNVQDLYVNLS
jgi:hypothetical protein